MNEDSLRRLLGFSLALLLGTAPIAAFAATGAVSPVTGVGEVTEVAGIEGEALTSQETAAADDGTGKQYDAPSTSEDTDVNTNQSENAGGSNNEPAGGETPDDEKPEPGVFSDGDKLYLRLSDGTVLSGTGWHQVDGSWYYAKAADGALATGWQKLGGKWYWLDTKTGVMATGILTIGGERYLFNTSGAMLTGWQKLDGAWYYLKSSGAMATGWQKLGGTWYWLDPQTGVMATGFVTTGGKTYLMKSSGAMATGWQKLRGTWYYLKSSGEMATGWQKLGGKWYWLDTKTGAMATGWKQVAGVWYRFNASGAMLIGWQKVDGTWYYLRASGAMATGWTKVNGKWYWLDLKTGAMYTGWLQQDGKWYWMDGNGAAAQNQIKVINGLGYAFDTSCVCHYGKRYNLSNETLTAKQQAIVNACSQVPSPGRALCAEWISLVFEKCGYAHLNLDACDMANEFCSISDLSKLKPGMLIAVKSHSHTWAGSIWGHVCIYIGGGKVMDNAGVIRVVDLDAWLWWYGDTVTPKWGWYNNYPLA